MESEYNESALAVTESRIVSKESFNGYKSLTTKEASRTIVVSCMIVGLAIESFMASSLSFKTYPFLTINVGSNPIAVSCIEAARANDVLMESLVASNLSFITYPLLRINVGSNPIVVSCIMGSRAIEVSCMSAVCIRALPIADKESLIALTINSLLLGGPSAADVRESISAYTLLTINAGSITITVSCILALQISEALIESLMASYLSFLAYTFLTLNDRSSTIAVSRMRLSATG